MKYTLICLPEFCYSKTPTGELYWLIDGFLGMLAIQESYWEIFRHAVQCRYNTVNFLKNIHKRHPIARPLGQGMGCLLWIQLLIAILPEFLQSFAEYLTLFDRVIRALDCNLFVLFCWQVCTYFFGEMECMMFTLCSFLRINIHAFSGNFVYLLNTLCDTCDG